MTTATDIFPSRYLTGAIWCDPEKYPQWKKLPHSIFDLYNYVPDQWQHTLLEFRFFYEWDGESPCILDFSAGCRFRLLVNGVFAEDGPVEVGGDFGKTGAPDWWFGDSRNVTPWLRHGKNEFRFQVVPVPLVQSDYTLGYGWVWSELHAGDTHVTPDNWQFRISHAYCRCAWRDEEENESEWLNDCVPVRLPLPVCFMDLPPLTNKKITVLPYLFPFGKGENIRRCGNKLLVKPGRPVTFFLKLPRLSAGHVEVRAVGQNSVKMFFECEELYGVRPDQAAEEFFASKPGESSCRTFRIYPCRYIKVNLIPSDFSTNSDCDDAVTLEFCFWARTWEPCRKRAIKNLPEPWLKKLDDRCLELLQVCMQRIHLDSPAHHEGLGCTGDYRIGANIAALAFGETRLARADLFRTTLLLRQQKKMFHTSYELCFVLMMQEYLERTGEKRFAESCYDAIRIVFEHFRSMTGPEGLISQAENYLFIDWAVDGNITYHHPPADRGTAAMTALWYGALQAMEKIAWLIDMPHDALLSGGWAIYSTIENSNLKTNLNTIYQKSYYDFYDQLNNTEIKMNKLINTNNPAMQEKLLQEISKNANDAQASLNNLPISVNGMEKCLTFINQVAGYTSTLSKQLANGKSLKSQDKATLTKLNSSISSMRRNLSELSNQIQGGYDILSNSIKLDGDYNNFTISLQSVNTSDVEYPTMIYDGPFAESQVNKKVKGLNLPEVDKEKAQDNLSVITKISKENLNFTNENHGRFACYNFEWKDENDNLVFAQVSKNGGKLLNMTSMSDNKDKNLGCYEKVLNKINDTLNDMLEKHSKIMITRMDLRYPNADNIICDSKQVSDFTYNLKRSLNREKNAGNHAVDAQVITVQEQDTSNHPHFHVAVIVNANAKKSPYSIHEKANNLWKLATGSSSDGLVDYCNRHENGIVIDRNSPSFEKDFDKGFYQTSYLAKVRGKESREKGSWLVRTTR